MILKLIEKKMNKNKNIPYIQHKQCMRCKINIDFNKIYGMLHTCMPHSKPDNPSYIMFDLLCDGCLRHLREKYGGRIESEI